MDGKRLEIAPATTALVVIDLQKGIVGRATEPRPAATVVANAAALADALRATGGLAGGRRPPISHNWSRSSDRAPATTS